MKVYIVDSANYLNSQEKKALKNQVKRILISLNLPKDTEICITFVNDVTMRNLNETYRGIRKTTDVLSFSQEGESFTSSSSAIATQNKTLLLGDIIISIETAKRNANRYKNSLKKEIQKLTIHGILHLLGYDHKKKKDAEKMREKENKLLKIIRTSATPE